MYKFLLGANVRSVLNNKELDQITLVVLITVWITSSSDKMEHVKNVQITRLQIKPKIIAINKHAKAIKHCKRMGAAETAKSIPSSSLMELVNQIRATKQLKYY